MNYLLEYVLQSRDHSPAPHTIPMPLVTNVAVSNVDTQQNTLCEKADRAELIAKKCVYSCSALGCSIEPLHRRLEPAGARA